MDASALAIFCIAAALGSYLQAMMGFALGIVLMSIVVGLDVLPVATAAAALNVLALFNTSVALGRIYRDVAWHVWRLTVLGMVPGTALGLVALDRLGAFDTTLLELALGIFVGVSGVGLIARPNPRAGLAPAASFAGIGAATGFLGGLFSIPGPPLIYHFYRQPLPLAELRATMLAVFFALCIVRLVIVIASGGLEAKAMNYGLVSVPGVALATWLSVRFPPPMSERFGRRFAFLLLALMGFFMCLTAGISDE